MADSAVTDAPLEEDIPCMHCGYNLRTKRPGENCPECGASVAESVAAHGAWWNWPGRRMAEAGFLLCGLGYVPLLVLMVLRYFIPLETPVIRVAEELTEIAGPVLGVAGVLLLLYGFRRKRVGPGWLLGAALAGALFVNGGLGIFLGVADAAAMNGWPPLPERWIFLLSDVGTASSVFLDALLGIWLMLLCGQIRSPRLRVATAIVFGAMVLFDIGSTAEAICIDLRVDFGDTLEWGLYALGAAICALGLVLMTLFVHVVGRLGQGRAAP